MILSDTEELTVTLTATGREVSANPVPLPVAVTVIVAVPTPTAATTPVDVTVATVVLEELKVQATSMLAPPVVGNSVSSIIWPDINDDTAGVTVKFVSAGRATVTVTFAEIACPVDTVAVTVVLQGEKPLIRQLIPSTDAAKIEGDALAHATNVGRAVRLPPVIDTTSNPEVP